MHKKKRKEIHEAIVTKAKRVVIKIGSGVLTRKGAVRSSFVRGLAREAQHLKKRGINLVIVSSGAIACGMDSLKLKRRPKNIYQKQAAAAMGQPLLMRHYARVFEKSRLAVAQILVTRDDLEHSNRFITAKHAIGELFRYGAIPIVNENDSVAVEEIKVGDNDQLSALVAHLVKADMLIILTDTDGFYNRDPKKFRGARRISVVERVDRKTFGMARGTLTQKSTGGMITKLLAARIAAKYGIPTWIVNGKKSGVLHQVFSGKDVGTLFLPKQQ